MSDPISNVVFIDFLLRWVSCPFRKRVPQPARGRGVGKAVTAMWKKVGAFRCKEAFFAFRAQPVADRRANGLFSVGFLPVIKTRGMRKYTHNQCFLYIHMTVQRHMIFTLYVYAPFPRHNSRIPVITESIINTTDWWYGRPGKCFWTVFLSFPNNFTNIKLFSRGNWDFFRDSSPLNTERGAGRGQPPPPQMTTHTAGSCNSGDQGSDGLWII